MLAPYRGRIAIVQIIETILGVCGLAAFCVIAISVGMSTSNFVGGIGLNGSANINIIITDRSGTSPTNWITGTFKLYGIKA